MSLPKLMKILINQGKTGKCIPVKNKQKLLKGNTNNNGSVKNERFV